MGKVASEKWKVETGTFSGCVPLETRNQHVMSLAEGIRLLPLEAGSPPATRRF